MSCKEKTKVSDFPRLLGHIWQLKDSSLVCSIDLETPYLTIVNL